MGVKLLRIGFTLCALVSVGMAQHISVENSAVNTVLKLLSPDLLQDETIPRKCATPHFVLAVSEWKNLSVSARGEIKASFARSLLQKSRLSPSGRFRIHYDTTGIHTPALLNSINEPVPNSHEAYVDSTAKFFDYCWTMTVDSMKYGPPLQDNGSGGGPEYDVYIEDLGSGVFGQTTFDDEGIGEGLHKRFASFITVDNDFRFVRTRGMDGLKVVAAHEFYHAVQLGSYGVWATASDPDNYSRDFYFYELTAVWMEDMLFPDVNDYLHDLPAYFDTFRDLQGRSISFTTFNFIYQGYERTLWAHYLAKQFGSDILRHTWEAMLNAPFLESMDVVLRERSTDFAEEYKTFSHWNYFTAFRADTARFYSEGHLYPVWRPNATLTYNPADVTTLLFGGYPLSTQFVSFNSPSDSIVSIIANVDREGAQSNPFTAIPFDVQLFSSMHSLSIPHQVLKNGMKAGFSSSTMSDWRVLHVETGTNTNASISPGPSPNPIYTSEISHVSLPVTTTAQEAEVFLLSSSLDLVFSGRYPVSDYLGKRFIRVPTGDFRSSVHSGIYFVVVHCPDVEHRWKVAVIR